MKHLIIFLLFFCGKAHAQTPKNSIEVMYKVAISEDGNFYKNLQEKPDVNYLYEGVESYIDLFDMQLWIGDDFSFYRTLEVAEPPNTQTRSFNHFLDIVNYDSFYFFNLKGKISYKQTYFNDKEILIKATQDNYDWNITTETKQIQGFTCYKAILNFKDRGGNFIAWFAPELPYPSGPLEFAGLPGLILELRTPFYVYGAKSINFKLPYKNIQLPNLPIRSYEEIQAEAEKIFNNLYK